jgi:8-amino-7-oxononanoate synthase
MAAGRDLFGLSAQAKVRLVEKLSAAAARIAPAARPAPGRPPGVDGAGMDAPGVDALGTDDPGAGTGRLDVSRLDSYRDIRILEAAADYLGIGDPFFRVHQGIAGAETVIGERPYTNFASYNYIGLNGDPRIAAAAKAAIDRYGTSVSASRPVSGERPIHLELERALARIHGAEDAIALVGGHATNVTVIGHLLGRNDLIVHDSLIHNSIVQGAILSGARRVPFRHLDPAAAGKALADTRARHGNALLVIEGHYSMDGDVPDLAAFAAVARRHRAWLMVDEAHALGVLGPRGFGSADRAGIDPCEVDIWMGTLSKALVSCGGYIAGRKELIAYLKRTAPGFVFSVGMAPPAAAAALEAVEILEREPDRVRRLNERARLFLDLAREGGLDVGGSVGAAIVPVITGSSITAARLAQALVARGINVQPILYPAVPERAARLRFFLTASHSEEQVRAAAAMVIEEHRAVAAEPIDLASVARHLGRRMTGGGPAARGS